MTCPDTSQQTTPWAVCTLSAAGTRPPARRAGHRPGGLPGPGQRTWPAVPQTGPRRYAVAVVRAERDDDIRPELADDLGHLLHQGRQPGVGEGAVDVVQAADLRDAEALAGQAQLGLP